MTCFFYAATGVLKMLFPAGLIAVAFAKNQRLPVG